MIRITSDITAVSKALGDLANSPVHVCDCRRLGHFKRDSAKPRSLLVTLRSTVEVSTILSNCRRLSSPISIRPYLTLSEHKDRNLYLTQWRKLIDAGVDSGTIVLKESGLFVSGKLAGRVTNSAFHMDQGTGTLSPELYSLLSGTTLPNNSYMSHGSDPLSNSPPSCESVLDSPPNSSFSPLSAPGGSTTALPNNWSASPSAASDSHESCSNGSQSLPSWLVGQGLSVCLWNARSIVNKLSSFQSFVFQSSIAIFALTETWLNDSYCDREILPSHYNVYRRDCSTCGGGVLLAVHSSLSSSPPLIWR